MKFKGMKQAGFSLVELMVVVGIIGILAAIAVPKLQQFTARSKQSEARVNLKSIHTMQQAYYTENTTFGDAGQIGFATTGKVNYSYAVIANNVSAYTARASVTARLCPGDADLDAWTISETGTLSNTIQGANGC